MARPSRTGGKISAAKARNAGAAQGRKSAKAKRRPAPTATRVKRRSVSDLTKELQETREQQAATAEILKVIASSPSDVKPVFEAIAASALRLCGAKWSVVTRFDGAQLHLEALHNLSDPEGVNAIRKIFPRPLSRGGPTDRAILTGTIINLPDVLKDPEYIYQSISNSAGYRSHLAVPMSRNGNAVGAITVAGEGTAAFTERHVTLLKAFADQAVIAVENTRLFNEVQERTRDLSESLQQQTATADVLKVISRSAFDLDSVMDTLTQSAAELCKAEISALYLREGDVLVARGVADANVTQAEFLRRTPLQADDSTYLGRTMLAGAIRNIADVSTETEIGLLKRFGETLGFSSIVFVPLMRETRGIGVFALARKRTEQFSQREVELVQTFADQAVIAIENVRLFNEVQAKTADLSESLQQQTATADVLKVISRSAFDLQIVLDTLTESAARLCNADMGAITRRDERGYYHATNFNFPVDWVTLAGPLRLQVGKDSVVGKVLLANAALQIPDVLADPDYGYSDMQAAAGYRTVLGVPLLRGSEPIGVLFLGRKTVQPFTDKQVELVQTFADQAVIAIENVRLFDEVHARTEDLRESLQQQTATADVLKVISRSTFDLQIVLDTLVESATRLCEADHAWLFQRDGDLLKFKSSFGHGTATHERIRELFLRRQVPINRGSITGRSAFEGRVVHVADVLKDPEYAWSEAQQIGGYRAALGAPLLRDGNVVGVIFVAKTKDEPFSEKQIDLVTTFADQAVIAIENVRLFEDLQTRTRDLAESLEQQTATSEVLGAISSSPEDLAPLFQTVLENAVRVCGAKFGTLNLYDGARYSGVATYNVPAEFESTQLHRQFIPHPKSALGMVAATHRPFQVEDIRAEAPYREGHPAVVALADLAGARTLVVVPMLKEDRFVGTIAIYRQEVNPFNDKQIALLSNFAQQAVIAIENNRLLKELRESLQQQTATADVLKVISRSTFDLQTVLRTLVESAALLCDADKATITRQRGHEFFRAESFGFSEEFIDYARTVPVTPERGSATGRALLEGVVVHIPDVAADPDYTFTEGQRLGDFRTLLGVPMMREGEPIGVIVLTRSEARPFTDKQIDLATTFADQAAIAIENVRLFESVEARTKELAASLDELRAAQDRLIQTEKLASLGQLTAGIAHEIKNPLNFINNFSALSVELVDELGDALKPAPLDDKTREETNELAQLLKGNLEKVVQHGKRADSIVKNMLLHSREGSGDRRAVDVNALVGESLNLAYHGARAEKGDFQIRLDQALDPAAGEVEVMPQEITRVLLNLISNGFYATTKRKVENGSNGYEPALVAATRNLGDRVEIRIRDNGNGISPDVKEKMFNPFFTTKPPGEGTGLGLSLSHDIVVKQHGGRIEVETEPGMFTEVIVTLPRRRVAVTGESN